MTQNGTVSNVLVKTYVSYINEEECAKAIAPVEVSNVWLCAKGITKNDFSCHGDSGNNILN